jgi:hypothetical protein
MNEAWGRLEVAVQHKGIQVRTIGPHDGPELVVHPNLRKEVGVGKWVKHRAVLVVEHRQNALLTPAGNGGEGRSHEASSADAGPPTAYFDALIACQLEALDLEAGGRERRHVPPSPRRITHLTARCAQKNHAPHGPLQLDSAAYSLEKPSAKAERCTVECVSRRWRLLSFGFAAALVAAGGACAALVGGVTGEVLTIVLISAGLCCALLLIFLEIGLDEERELARDDERRRTRKRSVLPPKLPPHRARWPRRPG